MKKVLTSAVMAAMVVSSASAELVTFEFDTTPYMAGKSTASTANTFTLGFKVNDTIRAGIMQESGNTQLTQGAAKANGAYNATALNLEYTALAKSAVDAIIGLNTGSLTTNGVAAGTSAIAAGSYMMTDIYAKVNYNASKNAFLDLKLGYRMLPIQDTGAANAFDNQNAPFLKVGVGVKF